MPVTGSDRYYRPPVTATRYRLGDWVLCIRTNRLSRDHSNPKGDEKDTVELEHRLVMLLVFLMDHSGEVLAKDHILKTIWQGKVVNEDSLAVAISHLRKALADNPRAPRYIKTIPGVGYQFIAEATPVAEGSPQIGESSAGVAHRWRLPSWPWLLLGVVIVIVGLILGGHRSAPAPDALATAQAQLDSGDPTQLRASIQGFKKLLETNPSLAEAYAGIALAKMQLLRDDMAVPANCEEILGLLNRALVLAPGRAAFWMEQGNAAFWCRRDLITAEQSYRQAISLQPADARAPMQYAQLLLAQGRFAESREQVNRARALNPLNYAMPTVVWIFQMQGRNDLADDELKRIVRTEVEDRYLRISAQRVAASLGRVDEAFSQWQWLMKNAGFAEARMAAVEKAFARDGLKGVNCWLLNEREPTDLGQYSPPLSWARYALACGEQDQALAYLEQAWAAHQLPLLWAAVDPAYDPVRQHPRFQALLAAIQDSAD